MATYEATIPSAWAADDTFGYLATFSNAAHWDPGTLAAEALDPGRVTTGSRFRLVVSFLGRRLPLTYEVTHYSVENRDVLLEATSGPLQARDRITVAAAAADDAAAEQALAVTAAEAALSGPPAAVTGSGGAATLKSIVSYRAEVTLRGPLRLLEPVMRRGFASVGEQAARGLAKVLAVPRSSAARTS
jgi:hypothetical protein